MASYFGEKVAFHFAWATFYTASLIWILFFGLAMFIYEMVEDTRDNENFFLLSLLISVWITAVNYVWSKNQKDLAKLLKMSKYQNLAEERDDFDYESNFDSKTGKIEHESFTRTTLKKIGYTGALVLCSISIIAGATYGFLKMYPTKNTIMVGIVNGIVIAVLNWGFTWQAAKLTNFENHRYKIDWENSYIIKIYAFQFVNSYLSLMIYSFYEENMQDLFNNTVAIFVTDQVLTFFITFGVPLFHNYTINKPKRLDNSAIFRKNYYLYESSDNIGFYCFFVIQIGFITMFSHAFPATPIVAFLINFFIIIGKQIYHYFYSTIIQFVLFGKKTYS